RGRRYEAVAPAVAARLGEGAAVDVDRRNVRADGQVRLLVAVDQGGEDPAELVVGGGRRGCHRHPAGQARVGALRGGDRAAVDVGAEVLAGGADGEVGVAVAVEVLRHDRVAEVVTGLGPARDAWAVLADDGTPGVVGIGGAAPQDDDLPGGGLA